jgi:cytoskeleton protein RodZ
MSEKYPMDQSRQAADAVLGTATAGALLKIAREAQGLHIDALAATLKVPVLKLEALEADRHEVLSDLVFTRALAASVCRVLKIDPAPIMAALPHSERPRFKTDAAGLNTTFKTVGVDFGLQHKNRLTSPLALTVALLLLGVLVLFLLPESKLAVVATGQAPTVSDMLRTEPLADPVASPAPVPQAALSLASQTVTTPVEQPVAATDEAPAILMLQSRGASWVEITDAQGGLQLRKILESGEQVRLKGPLPLSVVLGRADAVDVSVRGQRLDVTAMTKANVARFEVK